MNSCAIRGRYSMIGFAEGLTIKRNLPMHRCGHRFIGATGGRAKTTALDWAGSAVGENLLPLVLNRAYPVPSGLFASASRRLGVLAQYWLPSCAPARLGKYGEWLEWKAYPDGDAKRLSPMERRHPVRWSTDPAAAMNGS